MTEIKAFGKLLREISRRMKFTTVEQMKPGIVVAMINGQPGLKQIESKLIDVFEDSDKLFGTDWQDAVEQWSDDGLRGKIRQDRLEFNTFIAYEDEQDEQYSHDYDYMNINVTAIEYPNDVTIVTIQDLNL